MTQPSGDNDQRLIKALVHPLRRRIHHILTERTISPKQMSFLIEESLSNIAYHTRVLLDYDLIELVDTKPRNGAVEHFYRAKPHASFGSKNWVEIPKTLQGDLTAASLNSFLARAAAALEAGAFQERQGSAFSWQPLLVDEAGWREVLRILEEGEEGLRKVGEECAKRIGDRGHGIPIAVAHSAFETREGREKS
jgi:DNA-binding transcriptional ArsR family regulator